MAVRYIVWASFGERRKGFPIASRSGDLTLRVASESWFYARVRPV